MTDSFKPFESAIDKVTQCAKNAPRQEIVLSRLCHYVYTRLIDFQEEYLKSHHINLTAWMALVMIYARDGHSLKPSELSVYMDSSRTNSTRLADEMVEKGWVERLPCQTDRRQLYLRLTEEGIAFVERMLPSMHSRHRLLWSTFSDAEKTIMERLLRKLLKQVGG